MHIVLHLFFCLKSKDKPLPVLWKQNSVDISWRYQTSGINMLKTNYRSLFTSIASLESYLDIMLQLNICIKLAT